MLQTPEQGGWRFFVIGRYKAFSEILSCLSLLLGIKAGVNCGESKKVAEFTLN